MKKYLSFLLLTFFVLTVPCFAATPAYHWKFAHEELTGSFMDEVAREFARRLEEKSGGAIKIDIYPSGTLGTSEDMVELMQAGAVEFNWADAGHLGTQVPEAQVLLLHYLFPKNLDVVQDVLRHGTFRQLLLPCFQAKNIVPLGYFSEGWQQWTSNRPLARPEDFNGFKIRTMSSKLIVDNFKAYGANPTPIPFSEVYTSLQMNMVEGQENPAFVNHDMKFYEVQKYLVNGYSSPFVLVLATSGTFFDSLPPDIQKLIRETAEELIPFGFQWQEDFNRKQLAAMKAANPDLQIIDLTQEQMDAFAAKARTVHQSYFEMAPKTGPAILKALEDDIRAASQKSGQ